MCLQLAFIAFNWCLERIKLLQWQFKAPAKITVKRRKGDSVLGECTSDRGVVNTVLTMFSHAQRKLLKVCLGCRLLSLQHVCLVAHS